MGLDKKVTFLFRQNVALNYDSCATALTGLCQRNGITELIVLL